MESFFAGLSAPRSKAMPTTDNSPPKRANIKPRMSRPPVMTGCREEVGLDQNVEGRKAGLRACRPASENPHAAVSAGPAKVCSAYSAADAAQASKESVRKLVVAVGNALCGVPRE